VLWEDCGAVVVFTLAGLVLVGLTAELDGGEVAAVEVGTDGRAGVVKVVGAGVAVGLDEGRVEVEEGDDGPACERMAV